MLVVRRFLQDTSAVVGLAIVLFAVLVALFAGHLAPYPLDAYESHLLQRLQPPSWDFPFGTDNLGRDIFSRVILGTQSALIVALSVVAASILIGVPAGLFAGYFGGWLAEAIMRLTDVFLAVPQLILALALAQLMSPSLETAMIALTLTYWPFFARSVYAETQRLKVSVFVEALQGLGAGNLRVMFLHVLPNAASPVIVRATIGMGFTILTAAVLGFLGMGATPPEPDWGLAIAESRQYLPEAWWFATFPGLAIFAAVFGFNLLGDGVRDIVDPRLRRSR
jgi:peptide/nickel transport system permease protein